MIEINLLPGSVKRAPRRGLPRFGGGGGRSKGKLPEFDRLLVGSIAVAVLAIALVAWLHISTSARLNDLRADEEAAVRDSARYAVLRTQGDSLRAQLEAISARMEVIQNLDAGRYVWPHIMDEVSRTLPPYVWLVSMTSTLVDGGHPRVSVEGRAGNLLAVSRYMRELESSPFLGGARLISSSQTTIDERTVYSFSLEVGYEEPPADVIETVPLFASQDSEGD